MFNTKIEKILNQEMSRKQFLRFIGLGLLTIIGIPAIYNLLSPRPAQNNMAAGSNKVSGFGLGPYGI